MSVDVRSEVETDWRGLADHLVRFQTQDVLKLTVRRARHSNGGGILDLNSQIQLRFPFSMRGILVLPETFSIDSLNACVNVFMATNTLRTSQLFKDFAINNFKDCFEVKWLMGMITLPTVFEARLRAFWSVPPKLPPVRREHGRMHVAG